MPMNNVPQGLQDYVEREILPRYDSFDAAHQRDHALMVVRESLALAKELGADSSMAYVVAAFHDLGLCEGRDAHHKVSARIIRKDDHLRHWFSEEQIELMAEAAEDHRASSANPPRSLYGRIVAEADRNIDSETIVRRTIQYGFDHYPSLSREEHFARMFSHLHEKYGRGGYLQLWLPDSPNAVRLEQLRQLIEDEKRLRHLFLTIYDKLMIEVHPLQPFLPADAKILFLGSFPPPRQRWSMDFFYPNWVNDFWRIMGLIYFDNAECFDVKKEKRFDRERIVHFCDEQGLAFYDMAKRVRRLKGNASDDLLEIVEPTDVLYLMRKIPQCHSIVTTGGKASNELSIQLGVPVPPIGGNVQVGENLRWWRMPSSSRAYPMKKEIKAEFYRKVIEYKH